MKEWTEEEIKSKNLMAACGLYCGACGLYIATRDENEELKTFIIDSFKSLYGTEYEGRECLGCMQPGSPKKIYGHCKECAIRDCVKLNGNYSCHQCEDWPCNMIEDFPLAMGKRIIKRAIPRWQTKVAEYGDEKGSVEWARAECEYYHCSSCRNPLIRGTQRCNTCKKDVADELDGSL